MPANDLIEAPLQDFGTKWTFDTKRPGNVIDRTAWLQLIQEPQPLLGKRQRKIFIPRYTWQTRPHGGSASRSSFQMLENFSLIFFSRPSNHFDVVRQTRHRRLLKQCAEREL